MVILSVLGVVAACRLFALELFSDGVVKTATGAIATAVPLARRFQRVLCKAVKTVAYDTFFRDMPSALVTGDVLHGELLPDGDARTAKSNAMYELKTLLSLSLALIYD